jgi:Xaa-Pro aminopeptidase
MTELQAELCRAGARCCDIAGAVLKLARAAGLSDYVYHRPAHGIGMEGHQPPYLNLGDETVLEEGMLLSNEPGLYNPAAGWGYNHSNTLLVGQERGIVLNGAPLTREWCWIEL